MENISQTILKDLRVLEVGEGTAVGWCGRMLLDFGAQVFRLKNKSIKKLEDEGVCVENAHANENLKECVHNIKNIIYSERLKKFRLINLTNFINKFRR